MKISSARWRPFCPGWGWGWGWANILALGLLIYMCSQVFQVWCHCMKRENRGSSSYEVTYGCFIINTRSTARSLEISLAILDDVIRLKRWFGITACQNNDGKKCKSVVIYLQSDSLTLNQARPSAGIVMTKCGAQCAYGGFINIAYRCVNDLQIYAPDLSKPITLECFVTIGLILILSWCLYDTWNSRIDMLVADGQARHHICNVFIMFRFMWREIKPVNIQVDLTPVNYSYSSIMLPKTLWVVFLLEYGSGHEGAPVLLPAFAIKW